MDEEIHFHSGIVHPDILVSPITRIPPEISLEIIECCIPEDDFPRPSVTSAPLQLTHVCHMWRNLTLATPRLWRKLLVATRDFATCSIIAANALDGMALEVWMGRAGSLPMSIRIRYTGWTPESYGAPVFPIIVNNPTRWKDIGLSMPPLPLLWSWNLVQKTALNLENLELDDTGSPLPGTADHFGVIVRANIARTLATFSVQAPIRWQNTHETPFVRLRRLSMKNSFPNNCLDLLNFCPSLEDMTLHFCDLKPDRMNQVWPVILLPQLQNFRLAHTGKSENGDSTIERGCEIGRLLEYLQVPRLKSFYLWMTIIGSDRSADPNLPWDYLSQLIIRSNCSLNKLEFRSPHIDTPSIMECLRKSPHLKYLGIPANEGLECDVAKLLPTLDLLQIFK